MTKAKASFLQGASITEENQQDIMVPNEIGARFIGKDIDGILIHAAKIGVSDIHLKSNMKVKFSIYGTLWDVSKHEISNGEIEHFIKHLHGSSATSTLNTGKAIDSAYFIKEEDNPNISYRFRINSTKERQKGDGTYQITARVIPSQIPYLEDMSLPEDLKHALLNFSKGVALVTGATGSGKSTLLASIIGEFLRNPKYSKKIITGEAPIEFDYTGINSKKSFISQSQVPEDLTTFAKVIENSLRRAPNIILIGEARDPETIEGVVTASMTGHEVYTTIHSNKFSDTIKRMVMQFPEEARAGVMVDLISSIKVVVSQQLVPSADGKRVALREYVIMNDSIREKLLDGGTDRLTVNSKKVLEQYGHSFLQDAKEKFDAGKITKEVYDKIAYETRLGSDIEEIENIKNNSEFELIKALVKNQAILSEQIEANNYLLKKVADLDNRLKGYESTKVVKQIEDDLI